MKIKFIDHEGPLGEETYTDIDEVIIPCFKADSHDMFLRKSFANKENRFWKIQSLNLENNTAEFCIEEHRQQICLAEYSAGQKKKIKQVVSKFNIVDVDFGFSSAVFSFAGDVSPNKKFTQNNLVGEMHKKRPCIVLGVEQTRLLVIPLTTDNTGLGQSKMIEISTGSFSNMSPHYTDKTSYALLDMMQNVSTYRVYAPVGHGQQLTNKYRSFKLNAKDKTALQEKLASDYAKDIVDEKQRLSIRVARLEQERSKLLKTNASLKEESKEKDRNVDKYQLLIDDLATFFETEATVQALTKALNENL